LTGGAYQRQFGADTQATRDGKRGGLTRRLQRVAKRGTAGREGTVKSNDELGIRNDEGVAIQVEQPRFHHSSIITHHFF
jgi:hypothetical protein